MFAIKCSNTIREVPFVFKFISNISPLGFGFRHLKENFFLFKDCTPDESTLEMYEDEENFISDSEKVDQDEDLEDEVIPPKSASTKRPIGKKSKRTNDTKEAVLKKSANCS